MSTLKKDFVKFLRDNGAVLPGKYTLKGGDESDIFIDMGKLLGDPKTADEMAYFYAIAINDRIKFENFDVILGLPGKGVPIASAVSGRLARDFAVEKKVIYQRESPKDHGEASEIGWGTMYYGYEPRGHERVLFIDDVYTRGTTRDLSLGSLKEYSKYLEFPGHLTYTGMMVAVRRGEDSHVCSIVGLDDIRNFEEKNQHPEVKRTA